MDAFIAPVFRAAFADFKLVKTRSCAQLIFELPIEQADAALQTLGGLPRAATEVWAAIARLQPEKPASEPRNAPAALSAPKERQKFAGLPLPQQAAMRCQEPEFQRFIGERLYGPAGPAVDSGLIVSEVRHICGVKSRSQLSDADESGQKWRELDRDFGDWKHAAHLEGIEYR